ncbi:MAG: sensor histidine kinase [Planctomycetota bacterium]
MPTSERGTTPSPCESPSLAPRSLEGASARLDLGAGVRSFAHEAKNGLAGISAVIQLLAEGASPSLRRLVDESEERIRVLVELQDGLLLGGRALALRCQAFPLGQLLEGLGPEVSVTFTGLDAAAMLWGDPVHLRRLLEALCRNAREAAQRQPVRVALRRADERVACEVADAGPGLAEEVSATAFEPFVTTRARAHGLGLSIAERIARGHGGHVSLRWVTGQGTTASFSLPLVGRTRG